MTLLAMELDGAFDGLTAYLITILFGGMGVLTLCTLLILKIFRWRSFRLHRKHGWLLAIFFAPVVFLVPNELLKIFSHEEADIILLFYTLLALVLLSCLYVISSEKS